MDPDTLQERVITVSDQNSPIDVYYDMDIAQICAHFGKSRNTVDKAVAKLVKNYPEAGYKYKNLSTKRITIKAEGVEILSTYFRKEKHEISTVEAELRMENEKLNAILIDKDKTIANLESLYQERLRLELDKTRQTFLLEQKSKDDQIQEQENLLKEQNQMIEDTQKKIEESEKQISDLESKNQNLESENQKLTEQKKSYLDTQDEMEEEIAKLKAYQDAAKKKEEEYNSKSFFYRLTHKFSLN